MASTKSVIRRELPELSAGRQLTERASLRKRLRAFAGSPTPVEERTIEERTEQLVIRAAIARTYWPELDALRRQAEGEPLATPKGVGEPLSSWNGRKVWSAGKVR
jgi:hypothetical protein